MSEINWMEIAAMIVAGCTLATTLLTLWRACQTRHEVREIHDKVVKSGERS